MEEQGKPTKAPGRRRYNLAKEIFDAPNPELVVRSLPAQSLYLTCLKNGLASSADIIAMTTLEQMRLLLDFDIWQKDQIDEEKIWQWLELPDETNDLSILQKVLQTIDLKIISFLISKYAHIITFDDPTESPPEPTYYTPDKGYTWIRVATEDDTKDFLFRRLLALIFETDTDLFYKLLSIPGVSTASMLEEDSFQEKQIRLTAEGIPAEEDAIAIHSPIDIRTVTERLIREKKHSPVTFDINNIRAVRPLVYDSSIPSPLRDLLAKIHSPEAFETELTLLLNSGFVRWNVDFSDLYQVESFTGFVRGAINIALEHFQANASCPPEDAHSKLGLPEIYRAGLFVLNDLRKRALHTPDIQDATEQAILHGLRQSFPIVPAFLDDNGSYLTEEDGKLTSGFRAIEHQSLTNWLSTFLGNLAR